MTTLKFYELIIGDLGCYQCFSIVHNVGVNMISYMSSKKSRIEQAKRYEHFNGEHLKCAEAKPLVNGFRFTYK